MNTIFLIIWLKVNGTNAMMQVPIESAQCNAAGKSLVLPAGSTWACGGPQTAAMVINGGSCELLRHDDLGRDYYVCAKF